MVSTSSSERLYALLLLLITVTMFSKPVSLAASAWMALRIVVWSP